MAETHSRDIKAVVLLAPFTALADVATKVVPFIPKLLLKNYLLRHEFDNRKSLARLAANLKKHQKINISIFHGDQDSIVEFSQGQSLADECSKNFLNFKFRPLKGIGHNNIIDAVGDRIGRLIRAVARGKKTPKKSPSSSSSL